MMLRSSLLPLLALALVVMAIPVASAEWSGDAEVKTLSVNINFTERFTVEVTNFGSAPIEVLSIAVTIEWWGMPTLYKVFEGSAILAPGESREFVGPPTRMPNAEPATYRCFAGVVAKGADGVPVEHRFPSTIRAEQFSISIAGLPEEFTVPVLFALVSLAVTAALFRWRRSARWPFVEAVPRWGHMSRRT